MLVFTDPIVAGPTLVRPAIQSANFQTGVSGWQIQSNGAAEFRSLTLPGAALGNTGDVLTPNPYFLNGDTTGWQAYVGAAAGVASSSAGAGCPFPGALYAAPNPGGGGQGIKTTAAIPVVAGQMYMLSGWINPANSGPGVNFAWVGASTTFTAPAGITAGAWNYVQAVAQAPAGATAVTPEFTTPSGSIYGTGLLLTPQVPGTIIAPGSISSGQIAASVSLTSPVINGGTFNGTNWTENPSGQFLYSGTPAAGNLIASIAPAPGTDPYGNPYNSGVQSYVSGNGGAGLVAGTLILYQWTGSAWASYASVGPSGTALQINNTNGGGIVLPNGKLVSQGGTAAAPTLITTDSWHTIPLASPFSNSGNARYRLYPDNTVRLAGVINLVAAAAAGLTMFTLPAGYVPAQQQHFATANTLSGNSLGTTTVTVNTNGTVQCPPSGSNGNLLILDGVSFPLD